MIEIETVTIQLGEREYVVQEANFRRARPWKKRLFDEVQPIFAELGEAQHITFETTADLAQLMPLAQRLFVDAMDSIFELLVEYSPALEEDREYIETHATDKQVMAAFQEVLTLADPFGMINQLARRLGRSPRTSAPGESSSLESANGASVSQSVSS